MIIRRDLLTFLGGLLGALLLPALAGPAMAHEYEVGKLKVEHPWLRAPKEGETKAPFFMFVYNSGDEPDKLIGVKSEKFGAFELFKDAKGAPVDGIVIPAKSKVTLAPGGKHAMLLDIKKYLAVGWGLEMTLVFEKAGEAPIEASIDAPDAKHAHDAAAMQRWEKAQGAAGGGAAKPAPSGHEHHEHQRHMDKPAPVEPE